MLLLMLSQPALLLLLLLLEPFPARHLRQHPLLLLKVTAVEPCQ